MVSINFYRWEQNIRQLLLIEANKMMADEWDPFVAAWLCYALSLHGIENNQPLLDLFDRMKRWLKEDGWSYERNLGPIALCLWLFKTRGGSLPQEFIVQFANKVADLNADEKLSLLRDPEQAFLLALGASAVDNDSVTTRLINVSNDQIKLGPLRRRILYAAALKELGQQVTVPDLEPGDEGDIIAFVWWAEKYQAHKQAAWERFISIAERIALNSEEASDTQRILTVPEMGMLYEALLEETRHPEPTFLLDWFPLHPRIRHAARDHFVNQKYASAVFEATKALNEVIQECSGVRYKNEVELVQATMKQISDPSRLKIRFNEFLDEDSGKSEQAGLAAICEGVFKAFRNPKGHKPEGHPVVSLDAYEALQQLVIISYMMSRVEGANRHDKQQESGYGE